jgi:ABC-type phosphate transport system substrate-binding protein
MDNAFYRKTIGGLLLALCMLLFSQSPTRAESPDDLLIIVNKKFPYSKLSISEVKRIFTKEITTYRGIGVKPIHSKLGSPLRQLFVSKVMGMNVSTEQKYWQDMMVKKGMRPPIELSNTVRAVFSAPGAISYCYRRDFNPATAKIVLTL